MVNVAPNVPVTVPALSAGGAAGNKASVPIISKVFFIVSSLII